MTAYRITQPDTGVILGVFHADDDTDVLDVLARDIGYNDAADMDSDTGEDSDNLIVEECPPAPTTLDQLFQIMVDGSIWDGAPEEACSQNLDWSALPTFGGNDVEQTEEIWSWDETRMIVGTHAGDLEIVQRDATA